MTTTDKEKAKTTMTADETAADETVIHFDLECTGLSTASCRIVQIGAVATDSTGQTHTFDTLVHADRPMEPGASRVTGIKDMDLVGQPRIKEALLMFFNFVNSIKGTKRILCAYNGFKYDFLVLLAEMARNQMDVSTFNVDFLIDPLSWAKSSLDTTGLIRKASGNASFKLGDLHMALCGATLDGAHDALVDCYGLQRVCDHEKFKAMSWTNGAHVYLASVFFKRPINHKRKMNPLFTAKKAKKAKI